jgi:hypothetical protein
MRSWINVTLFGMLLSIAACFVEDPEDPSSTESTEGETESAVIIRPTPVPGPGFYYTCSDQPLVCRAGYGAVEFIPYPDCQPHAAHREKCDAGATDL